MTVARRVGVLGGTFDPIHCGHVDLGRAAASALTLTRLLVVPASLPPHRDDPAASSHHRFAMAAMAVAGLESWQVSDVELQTPGPSYTTTTLARLAAAGYEPRELFFVIGADAFGEVETWMNYPALLEQAHFAVVSRPGFEVATLPAQLPLLAGRMRQPEEGSVADRTCIFLIDAVTADVSSTAIRRRCAQELPLAGLIDPRVAQHIEQHGLYGPVVPNGPSDTDGRNGPAGRLHG